MTFSKFSQRTVLNLWNQEPLSGGDLGIEIEMEGMGPLGTRVRGWNVHEEGSLRQPGGVGRGGCEYVTQGAVQLKNVSTLVSGLSRTLTEAGVTIDLDAHRTSTHIHVNVKALPIIDVLGYLTVWSCVEPLFLALCGSKRDGNAFCISNYETGDMPGYINDFCKAIEAAGESNLLFDRFHDRGKYASLSTFRLPDLGTLEARCFPCSLDGDEITKWCSWLLNIRDIVVNEPEKHFRQIVKQGIHDPWRLANRIFGDINHPQVNELISFGAQNAYETSRLLKRYLNKTPEDYKKPKKKFSKAEFVQAEAHLHEMVNQWAVNEPPIPNQPRPMRFVRG